MSEHQIAGLLDELGKIKEAGGGLQKGFMELVRPSSLSLKKRLASALHEVRRQGKKGVRSLV
jgi:hypothetical protein